MRSPLEPPLPLECQRAIAAERDRIMRELHDGLGAKLVGALVLLEDDPGAVREVAEALRDAIDEMRLVIDSLDPEVDGIPTLLGLVRARVEPRLAPQGLRFEWQVADVAAPAFGPDGMLHVLRILQEAVTNVRKHANARCITVSTGERAGPDGRPGVWIAVADDGAGMPEHPRRGRGLSNMRYRAESLSGRLEIRPGAPGTVVELWIPAAAPTRPDGSAP